MASLSESDAQARALAVVQAYCGWHIAPSRDDEFVVDGSGASVQPLPTLRMTALLSLSDADAAVDVSSVEWSEAGFLRRNDGEFTRRLRGVVATVTHGHEAMPLDVTAVIDRLAARAVESSESSGVLAQVGQVRYAIGSDGMPAAATLTELDRAVLDRYRLPPRA